MARCEPVPCKRARYNHASGVSDAVPLPSFRDVTKFTDTDENCVKFLIDSGVIADISACTECGGSVSRYDGSAFMVRCTKKSCRRKHSLLKTSFFGCGSNLPCSEALQLGYFWLSKCSYSAICNMMPHHSTRTIVDYLGYFRQLAVDDLSESDVVIGGPGVIVELDESKFGKRKHNRGHRVDGVWVVGGVERTEQRKCFAVSVVDRSAPTLRDLISRHVAPGSIIHTDCWKGYQLEDFVDIRHYTVNHSKHFVDPESGVHTNSIEGTWNGFKNLIPARRRTKNSIDDSLMEFIWRRQNAKNLWAAFTRALKNISYE